MKRTLLILGAAAGATAATAAVAVAARRAADAARTENDRWHSITIHCEPEALGPLPPPLDALGMPVEVRIVPAPGDRGTELRARVPHAHRDDVRRLRRALREVRALAELGEVPLPDGPPTTHDTLLGKPLAAATRHGREEGRL